MPVRVIGAEKLVRMDVQDSPVRSCRSALTIWDDGVASCRAVSCTRPAGISLLWADQRDGETFASIVGTVAEIRCSL